MYGLLLFSPLALIGLSTSATRWLRSLRLSRVVAGIGRIERPWLIGVLAVAVPLAAYNVTGGPSFVEDEGTYTAQSWAVLHGHITPYFYTYDHPPLGWIQMAPFVGLLHLLHLGSTTVESARIVMAGLIVIDSLLLYVIARRLGVNRILTVAGLAFFLLSPLTETYLRRVYIDNVALPWLLVAVAVAVAPAGRRNYWLSGVAMGIAILSKETSLLFLPAVAMAAYAHAEDRWQAVRRIAAPAAAIAIVYPFWALARGQLGTLLDALRYQLFDRAGSGGLFDPGSARHSVVSKWFALDTPLLVVGAVSALLLLASRRHRWIAVAMILPLVQVVRSGGYLPYMAIIMLLPFCALAPAVLSSELLARYRPAEARRPVAALATACVAALALTLHLSSHSPSAVYRVDATASVDDAIRWTVAHTPADSRVLADDVVAASLQGLGRADPWKQALYVYKLDYDPQAKVRVPAGWRDIQYVIDTPMLLGSINRDMPQAALALQHSTPVATFGDVTVRRVNP